MRVCVGKKDSSSCEATETHGVARKACKEKCSGQTEGRRGAAKARQRRSRERERALRERRTSPGIRRRRQRQREMELLMDDHATQGARGLGCSSSSSSRSWMAPLGAPLRCVRNSQGRKNVSRAARAAGGWASDLTAQGSAQGSMQKQQPAALPSSSSTPRAARRRRRSAVRTGTT